MAEQPLTGLMICCLESDPVSPGFWLALIKVTGINPSGEITRSRSRQTSSLEFQMKLLCSLFLMPDFRIQKPPKEVMLYIYCTSHDFHQFWTYWQFKKEITYIWVYLKFNFLIRRAKIQSFWNFYVVVQLCL